MRVLAGFILCFLVGQGFTFCNVPLGMMFGALFTVIILKRVGIFVTSMPGSITVIQLSLGISIGMMFRDFSYGEHHQLRLFFALLLLCLSLQFTLSYFWCVRRLGWSKEEALLGAVPGAMAAVLALASHIKTPPQKIVISHSLRLITLTFLAGYFTRGVSTDVLASTPAVFFSGHNLLWLAGMVVAGYITGKFLARLHFPAPYMITSLICAAALHTLSSQPLIFPDLFNQLSMVLMGIVLGHHFTTFSMAEFGRHLWASVQLVLIGVGVTVFMAFITARLLDYPFPVLMLSWVPGSVESMSFAALALKADASFVMANHIIRMLLIHTVPAMVLFRKRQMRVD